MSCCLNRNVLKVITSEVLQKKQLHTDVLLEMHLLQGILRDVDTRYFKLPGYIQPFSLDPFGVHMYTELGMSILVDHLRRRLPVSLYLDATGGVVSKIADQPKQVLYSRGQKF